MGANNIICWSGAYDNCGKDLVYVITCPINFKTIPSGLQKKFSLEKQMSTTCVKVELNSTNLSKHLMGNLNQIAKFPPTDT